MLPYVLLAAGAFVLAFISKLWPSKREVRGWNLADIACVVLLVVFSATRLDVGTDYESYENIYGRLDVTSNWWNQVDALHQDLGYTMFAFVVKWFSADPHAIFWATSVVTVVPVYAALRKQSKDLPFAVLLFILLAFYTAPFNIIRQGMAMALVFWGYSFIKKSKIAFILIGVVAALLHSTAIIAVPIMLLGYFWKPRLWSSSVLFGIAALGAGAIWTVPAVRSVLEQLNKRYLEYIDTAHSSGITAYLMIAVFLLLAIPIAKIGTDRPDWLAMIIIGIAMLILSTQSPVAVRMFNYFGPFVALALPNVLVARKDAVIIKIGVTIGAFAYFAFMVNNFAGLVPYESYL